MLEVNNLTAGYGAARAISRTGIPRPNGGRRCIIGSQWCGQIDDHQIGNGAV